MSDLRPEPLFPDQAPGPHSQDSTEYLFEHFLSLSIISVLRVTRERERES